MGSPAVSHAEVRNVKPASNFPRELEEIAQKWSALSLSMKEHSHSAAELLMQQAGASAQLEDLFKKLLLALKHQFEEKGRLQAQILQDRADFTTQAKLLSQHFTLSHHRSTALQEANEALQGDLGILQEQAEHAEQENNSMRMQIMTLQKEVEREQKMGRETDFQEHSAVMKDMQEELTMARSRCEELASSKAQLQSQIRAMVVAERELTEHLKHTHAQIDQQLILLREQLQSERTKRMQANKRKVELAQQQQQHGEGATERNVEATRGRQLRQAFNSSKIAPSLRNALMRRIKTVKVAMPSGKVQELQQVQMTPHQQNKPTARYTAAFAPPSTTQRSGSRLLTPESGVRSVKSTISPQSGITTPGSTSQKQQVIRVPFIQFPASEASPINPESPFNVS
ncbi:hypothetical protein CEUSTIGMA_g8952.t1 [Chlamydomonas eustigma]|uniref:Uncharacterized protein n=1 Tax=Chlamydomonas eustigma TaxID=1157962 RepID=A0A250XEL4_9CHLO|nr:hypothetical protein CEUSTIGMA_g8952.t1 [Chlamydomonas eustigma]|eukprot:GAX81524.1 hypothetical protein CEUSTIGMA_g8952.t1 [Chlamydomonas eustigma]